MFLFYCSYIVVSYVVDRILSIHSYVVPILVRPVRSSTRLVVEKALSVMIGEEKDLIISHFIVCVTVPVIQVARFGFSSFFYFGCCLFT